MILLRRARRFGAKTSAKIKFVVINLLFTVRIQIVLPDKIA